MKALEVAIEPTKPGHFIDMGLSVQVLLFAVSISLAFTKLGFLSQAVTVVSFAVSQYFGPSKAARIAERSAVKFALMNDLLDRHKSDFFEWDRQTRGDFTKRQECADKYRALMHAYLHMGDRE